MPIDEITLRYDGDIQQGMDSHVLGEALVGFSDFLSRISLEVYGEDNKFSTNIREVKPGSSVIEALHFMLGDGGKLILAASMDQYPKFLDLITECFSLFKHLDGEQPKNVKKAEKGGLIVENNRGEIINVNIETLNIVSDELTGNATEKFVKRPIAIHGAAKTVEIKIGDEVLTNSNEVGANCFVPIGEAEDDPFVSTIDFKLMVVSPVLYGDGKWRLHDGSRSFWASIEDEEFLSNVTDGSKERFGNGDILFVRLRSEQVRIKRRLRTNHFIEEVYDHEIPEKYEQSHLFDEAD